MYQISDQQIDYILNDISARGVEMESLQQNLLDHVCCIIENNLEENGDFESFYQKTIKTFYEDELWEIEEETLLLLTYKNYYTMKKVMINSGIAAATFFIIGSFFKFMHWPGASALILLGMAIGALVFLPLIFVFKKNETTESKGKLVLGIGVINGILFCLYSLFKVMHWPGASMLWFATLGIFSLLFIPLYFFNGIKNPANKVNTITTSLILIMVAGVFFLQTSLKSSKQVYIAKTKNYLMEEKLLARLKETKNDTLGLNIESTKIANDIINACAKLKGEIIKLDYESAVIPENFESNNHWMEEHGLGEDFQPGGNGEKAVLELRNLINQYNNLVKTNDKTIPNTIDEIISNKILQQSNYSMLSCLSQIQLFVLANNK